MAIIAAVALFLRDGE